MSWCKRALWIAAWILVACGCAAVGWAQSFQNLNFETVVTGEPTGPENQPLILDVPGWTFSHGPPLSVHLGGTPLQFLVNAAAPGFGGSPLEGQYSLLMTAGGKAPEFTSFEGAWIEQTGVAPGGTKSVRLKATSQILFQFPPPDPATYVGPLAWHLSLNGADVPLILLPNGDYSGDATAFANALATLRVDVNEDYPIAPFGAGPQDIGVKLDAIRFSPLPYTETPEPTGAALGAIAMASVARRMRRRDV